MSRRVHTARRVPVLSGDDKRSFNPVPVSPRGNPADRMEKLKWYFKSDYLLQS